MLKNKLGELEESVKTIDSWQGRESQFIIFSAVRKNGHGIGFLENEKRMNVALTRAQHGMIIVGNAKTLQKNEIWKNIIDKFREDKTLVYSLDEAIDKIEMWERERDR